MQVCLLHLLSDEKIKRIFRSYTHEEVVVVILLQWTAVEIQIAQYRMDQVSKVGELTQRNKEAPGKERIHKTYNTIRSDGTYYTINMNFVHIRFLNRIVYTTILLSIQYQSE